MPITINSRILLSLASIAAAAALLIGATFAFFSDSETSTGNTFTSGTLDLKVDSQCHYFQNGSDVGCDDFGNWSQTDLEPGVHTFFDFDDTKPGDWGENTISLHVVDNDAWGRFIIDNITDNGELRENMEFWIWVDQGDTPGFQGSDTGEGDNVWDPQTEPLVITPGTVDLPSETWNIWDALTATWVFNGNIDTPGVVQDGRMVESITYYFGLAWCFGEADPSQGGLGACDGSGVGNDVQGDSLTGDLNFEVVQHRNNPNQTF